MVLPSARTKWRSLAEASFGIRLVKVGAGSALVAPRARTLIDSPDTAAAVLAPFFLVQTVECFVALFLDVHSFSMTTGPVEITRGILDQSQVHPRELFRAAIAAGAHSIIVAHNHPSGDPTPSIADRMVTKDLHAAGILLGIPVHDHVIIAANGLGGYRFTSFASAGLL